MVMLVMNAADGLNETENQTEDFTVFFKETSKTLLSELKQG
jgi:hypothetical protein